MIIVTQTPLFTTTSHTHSWPTITLIKHKKPERESIAKAAQGVLDARKHYQDGSENAPTLAQLYNTYLIDPYPLLTKAHKALDEAVDSAYGYRGKGDDASRVEFLIKKIAELDFLK